MADFTQLIEVNVTEDEAVQLIRDALATGVVLDTWMNGEQEEDISVEALQGLTEAERVRVHPAIAKGAVIGLANVLLAFHEIVMATALYRAQQRKGRRAVDRADVSAALERVDAFVAHHPLGWVALRTFYLIISTHEDFNALEYYGSMPLQDFLLGNLHRPWSDGVFRTQLAHYQRLGLVHVYFRGSGDMVMLTDAGRAVLDQLRRILDRAGELSWRAEAQRWTIFGELNYDVVIARVFPDFNDRTRDYLSSVAVRPGMQVLEVGCGTGRVTVDLGLCERVGDSGRVVALDPSRTLLDRLEAKQKAAGITNVEAIQGRAERLPFPDDTFDVTLAVASLHFTDVEQAMTEMVRVTKPGGLVTAWCPPPDTDVRAIPMVAMWFRPLVELAERWQLRFGDHNGLPPGCLESAFRRHLSDVRYDPTIPICLSAADPDSFLAFVLKGGAFFQNLLCRVPYADRWQLIRRLETMGQELVRHTEPTERYATYRTEAVYGRVPG